MRSKWVGKALCSFVGTAVLALGVSTGSPLIMGALASPDDEFVTQEDLKALKEEVKTLKDELKSIKAVKSEEVPAITGNVYSELSRKIKLGGEIRARFESFYNFDFTGKSTDTFDSTEGSHRELTLLRTRLNLDADINDYLRAFLELQDSRSFGEEGSTTGNLSRVDLRQSFIELKSFSPVSATLSNLSMLAGRWVMLYGEERVIGPLDWSNVGRKWDGARIRYSKKDAGWIDAFVTQIDETGMHSGATQVIDQRGATPDRDEVFWGIYAQCTALKGHEIEPYFLGRNQAKSTGDTLFGPTTGDLDMENRYTVGLRFAGEPTFIPGVDYELEANYQFGNLRVSGENFDIAEAYSFYADAGYTLKTIAWTPRAGAGFAYATGTSEKEIDDGEINTFDQLYPTGHRWLGYMDLVGRQNIIDYIVNLSAKPTKKWLLRTDIHFFYLEEAEDNWYNAAGFAVAKWDGTGSKPDDQLGQEVDVVAKYSMFKNFAVELGYSHFFQGNFIESDNVETTTGKHFGNSDADWFYVMTTLKF